jgi:hypothetical protein
MAGVRFFLEGEGKEGEGFATDHMSKRLFEVMSCRFSSPASQRWNLSE